MSKTFYGAIDGIKRLNDSVYGNPRYRIWIGSDEYTTSSNIMDAYAISENWRDRAVKFTLTRAGRIATIKLVGFDESKADADKR